MFGIHQLADWGEVVALQSRIGCRWLVLNVGWVCGVRLSGHWLPGPEFVFNVGPEYSLGVLQTKNRLLIRFQGHFNDIAHDQDTTVARHLNRCNTEGTILKSNTFTITILSFVPTPPESMASKIQRDRLEKRWMHRLITIMPEGLNLMD